MDPLGVSDINIFAKEALLYTNFLRKCIIQSDYKPCLD